MDKDTFLLNEKIKFDKFNDDTEKEFLKRYNVDNKIKEYFESDDKNSSSLNEEKKRKNIFYNFFSPVIDLSKRFYSSVQLIYEPKLYHLSFFLTTLWAYKNIKCVNKLLQHKYNDIFYQIIRPDSLSSRNKAFKILVVGGLTIPLCSFGFVFYDVKKRKQNSFLLNKFDNNNTSFEQKKMHIIPYTVHRRISNSVSNFKDKVFFFAKDFAENNNFKKLSTEYHKNVDMSMKWFSLV